MRFILQTGNPKQFQDVIANSNTIGWIHHITIHHLPFARDLMFPMDL